VRMGNARCLHEESDASVFDFCLNSTQPSATALATTVTITNFRPTMENNCPAFQEIDAPAAQITHTTQATESGSFLIVVIEE
jgi:hypothetical protein